MSEVTRPSQVPIINLRVHSAYSLLEGALQIKDIIARTLVDGLPAIAITDTNNLFGALQFADAAKSAGIQPLIGVDIDLAFDGAFALPDSGNNRIMPRTPVVLFAMNETGYENLVRLVSALYLEPQSNGLLRMPFENLGAHSEGLLLLTGGPLGPIGSVLSQGQHALAEARIAALKHVFGDRLYVELQRTRGYDRAVERSTVDLAYRYELPLVAVNEAFFADTSDYEAHDALLAIAEGTVIAVDERRRLTPDHHLKTQSQMRALFADLPEALINTSEVAQRCSFYPKSRNSAALCRQYGWRSGGGTGRRSR
jgi:DNA polymerase III subunit alpha